MELNDSPVTSSPVINSETVKYPSLIKKKSRKLSVNDLNDIARLVSTRKMTETDACIMLGISVKQWFNYKSLHKRDKEFADTVIRMREDKICGMVDLIEDSAKGIGIKQRDWRAGAWIAERLAPERFAQVKGDAPVTTNNLNVMVMGDTLKRIYSVETEKPVQLLEAPASPYVPKR